jgi:signal peptidase I
VFATYRVLSGSMLPTLRPGDWLAVDKLAYGVRLPFLRYRFNARTPHRGDVVAFETPPGLLGQPARLVKRVIGLPGDRVEVKRGQTFINGWAVPLCDAGAYVFVSQDQAVTGRLVVEFLDEQAYLTVYFGGSETFEGYTVKNGEVFVLGDNRNNSSDSRAWNGGQGGGLPLRAIEGRVPYVLLASHDSGGSMKERSFLPLWHELQLQGVDTTELQKGIDKCLREAPAETTPPAR